MAVSTFVQPDFTSQSATVYKTSIDDAVAVHHQIAGPFAPHEQAVPDLTVRLDAANFSDLITRTTITKAAQSTGALSAPSVNPRKDIVHVDRLTGDVGVETGAEDASPVDPTIPVGKLPVARINWTTSTTEITNTDLDDIRAIGSLGLSTAAFINVGTTDGLIPTLNADGGLTQVEVDAGATSGPLDISDRDSSSPTVSDFIGAKVFRGRSSTDADVDYVELAAQIILATNGSEDARAILRAMIGGSLTDILTAGPGVQVGAPTGGDKGAGTGNFENGVYNDGVFVSEGLVLLSSASPSAVASADFASIITATYRRYLILYDNLIPATDGIELYLRTSTNNGGAYDAGASDYSFANFFASAADTSNVEGDAENSSIIIAGIVGAGGIGNGSAEGCSGHFYINDPLNAAIQTTIYGNCAYWTEDASVTYRTGLVGGARNNAADVDAFQLIFSSGNITSGEIRVYGIKDA